MVFCAFETWLKQGVFECKNGKGTRILQTSDYQEVKCFLTKKNVYMDVTMPQYLWDIYI